jgi:hypothetical protein
MRGVIKAAVNLGFMNASGEGGRPDYRQAISDLDVPVMLSFVTDVRSSSLLPLWEKVARTKVRDG